MNLLITGATGFIGQHLTKKLQSEGYQIFQTTRKISNERNSVCIEELTSEELSQFLIENKIRGIIHLASLFLVNHQPNQVSALIESNITFPTKILESAKTAKTPWFLNTGTFWQHYENQDYNPVNLYAATKQAFEDILRYYSETSEIKFLTLELSDTFGPHDTRPKIFNKWKTLTADSLPVDMSPGDQEIDILYISDVVAAYLRAIELLEKKTDSTPEKYSLRSGETHTLKNIAHIFAKTFSCELKINWGKLPYREREVMRTWTKGAELPGWKPKHNFQSGCEQILLAEKLSKIEIPTK